MPGYIGNVPTPQSTQSRQTFTATAGQTTFGTVGYSIGYIDVFLNGVHLVDGTDYTATNGSDIVLSSGAALNDVLEVVIYSTFEVANFTSVGSDIVPSTDDTFDLGSSSKAWAEAYVNNINGGTFAFRNIVPNSDFSVDQRGNAAGVTANIGKPVDNVLLGITNDVTTQTLSRVAADAADDVGAYGIQYEVTTGSDSSLAAGQYALSIMGVEGYDHARFHFGTASAKTMYVTIPVKCSETGTYCLLFRNGAFNRSYVTEFTIAAANTVQLLQVQVPGDTSGTWDKTNGVGLQFGVCYGTGSTFQTTADTWAAGTFFGTSSQNNLMATNGATFTFYRPQIEEDGFSPYQPIPYGIQLSWCQRYYAEGGGVVLATNLYDTFEFPVNMRTTPTMSYAGNQGATFVVNNKYFYQISNASSISGFSYTAAAELV